MYYILIDAKLFFIRLIKLFLGTEVSVDEGMITFGESSDGQASYWNTFRFIVPTTVCVITVMLMISTYVFYHSKSK